MKLILKQLIGKKYDWYLKNNGVIFEVMRAHLYADGKAPILLVLKNITHNIDYRKNESHFYIDPKFCKILSGY